MAIDLDHLPHLSDLLHLHKAASEHPKLKPIADEAMRHLEEYAADLTRPAGEVATPTEITDDQGVAIGDAAAGPGEEGEHS